MATLVKITKKKITLPPVREVSLLTKEEYESHLAYIDCAEPCFDDIPFTSCFYLKDADEDGNIYLADGNSGVYDETYEPDYYDDGPDVGFPEYSYGTGNRPAIRFSQPIPGAKPGDKMEIQHEKFTVIAPDIILLDRYISVDVFDDFSSDYEGSAIQKRVDKWFKGIRRQFKVAENDPFTVGSHVTLGSYEQNNTRGKRTEIEWVVLEKTDDKALLISRYGLDAPAYNTEFTDITWEKSSIRRWLNETFLNKAFSEEEQGRILTSQVTPDQNPDYETEPEDETQDKIFLLSIPEALKYFNSDKARMCEPTDYAIAQGAYVDLKYKVNRKGACWWWLRTSGDTRRNAANVHGDGSIRANGRNVSSSYVCVRPAFWISLK